MGFSWLRKRTIGPGGPRWHSQQGCWERGQDLKMNHSVIDYVHFTFQTDDCTDPVGQQIGDRCVDVYSSLFYVKVKNVEDLTDLENTVSDTDTQIRSQNQFRVEWFTLYAEKIHQKEMPFV